MKRSLERWILGAALVTLVAAPVAAQGRPRHGRGPADGAARIERMAEALDLSDEQVRKIETIMAKYRDGDAGKRREGLHDARRALGARIHDPDATDAQVLEAANSASAQHALVAVDRHRMVLEIRSVLTGDQQAKAARMRERRLERRGGPPSDEADDL